MIEKRRKRLRGAGRFLRLRVAGRWSFGLGKFAMFDRGKAMVGARLWRGPSEIPATILLKTGDLPSYGSCLRDQENIHWEP